MQKVSSRPRRTTSNSSVKSYRGTSNGPHLAPGDDPPAPFSGGDAFEPTGIGRPLSGVVRPEPREEAGATPPAGTAGDFVPPAARRDRFPPPAGNGDLAPP